MTYRRTNQGNTWHWRDDCSRWPTEAYYRSVLLPRSGYLCLECKCKDVEGTRPDPDGAPASGAAEAHGHELLSAAELERIRDEMRMSNDRTREELDRLEGLLILARERELHAIMAHRLLPAPSPVAHDR